MAFYNWDYYPTLAVPWNSEEGVIGCEEMVKEKCHLAMPTLPKSSLDPAECEGLIGYPVHFRCWELPSHHRALGSIAKTNLGTILAYPAPEI
ncbi:uncharacterized protein ASPGLDRAFT_48473 [Aspergillus glaucus CBS 516.65]|uniref:Uncharacterized protein n=1 Tax=Aspergillus glaucus CBS 516.65 TaxID=1160497 RepID=A0A1L9VGN0_ASPGL|nr:hypothetical protein ASPGLDRAFT_48473 [Aspergillus glaucus CBS 516.65]OJJ83108.1 hypothetical protein ASPGLDRAFT_48473 [Aspergillus glaucus CBS 516.65]